MSERLARLTSALADRYRLERELGQGGMATVYLAHEQIWTMNSSTGGSLTRITSRAYGAAWPAWVQ